MRAMPQWKHLVRRGPALAASPTTCATCSRFPTRTPSRSTPRSPSARRRSSRCRPTRASCAAAQVYLKRCWMCHGDAGQGEGPDGEHLVPAARQLHRSPSSTTDARLRAVLEGQRGHRQHRDAAVAPAALRGGPLGRHRVHQGDVREAERARRGRRQPAGRRTRRSTRRPYEPTPDALERGKATYDAAVRRTATGPRRMGDGKYGAPLMPTPANLTEEPAVTCATPAGGTGASTRASSATTRTRIRRRCPPGATSSPSSRSGRSSSTRASSPGSPSRWRKGVPVMDLAVYMILGTVAVFAVGAR